MRDIWIGKKPVYLTVPETFSVDHKIILKTHRLTKKLKMLYLKEFS